MGQLVYQEPRIHREIPRLTWRVERLHPARYSHAFRMMGSDMWRPVPPGETLDHGVRYQLRRGCQTKPLESVIGSSCLRAAEPEGGACG